MHFFGGGYTDIKPAWGEWDNAFDKIIASDPQFYAISRPVTQDELPAPYSYLGCQYPWRGIPCKSFKHTGIHL